MKDKMIAEEQEILDWFEQGELYSASEADHEHEVALQAAHNTRPIVSYIEALGTRLKMIAEFLKGRSENRPWAVPAAIPAPVPLTQSRSKSRRWAVPAIVVPAMAIILAIVVPPGDKDYEELKSMLANYEERRSMLAKSTDRQRELVMAHSAHATDKIRLLVETEEHIKEYGLPEMDHRWNFLAIGEPLDLKGRELKGLIGLSGKLKKGSDYQIKKSQGTTSITFTNNILSGQAVLAVVEAKN